MADDLEKLFKMQKEASLRLRTEPLLARKERLRSLNNWILTNRPALHKAMMGDLAKPPLETDATEIFSMLNESKLALDNLDRWTKPKKLDAPIEMIGTTSWIQYEPKGTSLIIAAWNYPLALSVGPLISALAAGCTAIVKPSELAPNISAEVKRMVEIFEPSIVSVVEGEKDISKKLLTFPFDHIFFTGSPGVGKQVMKAAAENLASVTLELGGKSPVIVTASAKIKDAALKIAVTKFINNGQTCVAPDYVLVDKKVASEFTAELISKIKSSFIEKGGDLESSPHYARLVSEQHLGRLTDMLEEALQLGAKPELTGPISSRNKFMHPVVISNVPLQARIMNEEIFGPILPVVAYENLDEALDIIVRKPKPLSLYIFSNNRKEIRKVLQVTSSGGACVNDCALQFLHSNIPFGGVNGSGIGKSHGYAGFLAFSNEKPVLKQNSLFSVLSIFYPPFTKKAQLLLNWFFRLFYGTGRKPG